MPERQSAIERNWVVVSRLGAALVSVVAAFVMEPPRLLVLLSLGGLAGNNLKLANYVVAIAIGFASPWLQSDKKSRGRTLIGVALLVGGISTFFIYQDYFANWSCEYDGRGPVVIGAELTTSGQDYWDSQQDMTCTRALLDSGGQVETLWFREQMIHRYLILAALYCLTVLLLSLAAFFMLRALKRSKE